MADDWIELPFSEAVLLNPATPLTRGSTYPFVDMAAVTSGARDVSCSEQREFNGSGSRFQDRDTLMARITPCLENGKLARFRAPTDQAVGHGSTEFIVVRGKPDVTDNDFAYYLTISPEIRSFAISQMIGSSGRQRVPTNSLGGISVLIPSLMEQRKIVAVLNALDDKIEVNQRMNTTLERMARALFQSWFVDFDPVRSKLDGNNPKFLDEATAKLFPNAFQESELGHIPKGWRAGTLSEGFNITMGQSPPGNTYNELGDGLPFYQGCTDFGFRFPKRRIYCTAPNRTAKDRDTLVSVRAPVGDINMAKEDCCIGRGVAAVRHKSGASSFTYHAIANLYPNFAKFEAEGTVFGSINKDSFEKLPFVIPPAAIVSAFERLAEPLDEQIRILVEQSHTLANIRNALLPKLLNGELSVENLQS